MFLLKIEGRLFQWNQILYKCEEYRSEKSIIILMDIKWIPKYIFMWTKKLISIANRSLNKDSLYIGLKNVE